MDGRIIELIPENYGKCRNIWDMNHMPGRTQHWLTQLLSGNRRTFVFEKDGEYLGEGSLMIDRGDPDYTIADRRIYLSRMVAKKEYRGQGIGSKIIEFLFDHAKSLGYTEMSVGVDSVNTGARRLYERSGFDEVIFEGKDAGGEYVKLLKKL